MVTNTPPPRTRTARRQRNKKKLWTVPELWPGATCYILGGGPSLGKIDVNRLRGHRVIAVNNAYELGDWIDVMFYGDCRWLPWHSQALRDWPGLKVTSCMSHTDKPGIKVVERRNSPQGITTARNHLRWNLSSGASAINLAVHFGVKRIVLLGFDMRLVDEKNNWHDSHQDSPNKNPYQRFLKPFPLIAKDLKQLGIECINATPGSALDVWPVVDPEEVLP